MWHGPVQKTKISEASETTPVEGRRLRLVIPGRAAGGRCNSIKDQRRAPAPFIDNVTPFLTCLSLHRLSGDPEHGNMASF